MSINWAEYARSILQDDPPIPTLSWQGNVIIVGAGAAGLSAAYLLHKAGINVEIIEASSRYGGRVRSLEGFADYPIELGAEEVEGDNSVLRDFVLKTNIPTINLDDAYNYVVLNNEMILEKNTQHDPIAHSAYYCIDMIQKYKGPDINIEAYIESEKIPLSVHHIINFYLGHEWGSDINRIGIVSFIKEKSKRTVGDNLYFLINKSMISVLENMFRPILSKIKTNTQITSVNYSHKKIKLHDAYKNIYEANKVIMAVPLKILQKNIINFTPLLPQKKTNTIHNLGADVGIKYILKFTHPFWSNTLGRIIGKGFIPDFRPAGIRSNQNNIMVGYVFGHNAEYLKSLPNYGLEIIIQELEEAYHKTNLIKFLQDYYIQDWSEEPFIQAAFSYPNIGSAGAFEELSKPINDTLFFAGEATNFNGHFGTVHGAIESGFRAAHEIIESIKKEIS